MQISGNIGETVLFNETGAEFITGVLVGSGEASFQIINHEFIDVRVPSTASWGSVIFQRPDITEFVTLSGVGYEKTGALTDLENTYVNSGYSGYCSSGEIVFSNVNEASGVCSILVTGASESGVSGKLNDAYASGFCGSEEEGTLASGSYQLSTTRLNDIFTSKAGGNNIWVSIATVEDTGNFDQQKATSILTCTLTGQDTPSSDYFVPTPRVTSISPNTGTYGENITVSGFAFHGLSGAALGQSQIQIQLLNNNAFSFSVPSGDFDDYITVYGQSGVSSTSVEKFSTSVQQEDSQEDLVLSLNSGQLVNESVGFTGVVNIYGNNILNLTGAVLIDESDSSINIYNNPSFNYASSYVEVPLSGLTEGSYSLNVFSSSGTGIANQCVYIKDAPVIGYSCKTIWSSGIGLNNEYSSKINLESALISSPFEFPLTNSVDKICVDFSGTGITGGDVYMDLGKRTDAFSNLIRNYTIIGQGNTSQDASANAFNKFLSGQYTFDEFGDKFDEYSSSLDQDTCVIISSGDTTSNETHNFVSSGLFTGVLTGNQDDHPFIISLKNDVIDLYNGHQSELACSSGSFLVQSGLIYAASSGDSTVISTTGLSIDEAINAAQVIIDASYPNHTIISRTSGASGFQEAYYYESGIVFPFSTTTINDHSSQVWVNIWSSGMNELYPSGYNGGDNLTSGFDVITGLPISSGTLTESGKDYSQALSNLETELADNYSTCTTGSLSSFTTGQITTPSYTSRFFGYC
tara:strand:+ start:1230 stop:3476 length:2247 start_codon:yes stop_codon:yes gene_type:complete